jgi:cytochrome-b5 reductase
LKAVETINHNTKKFTFELPNPNDTLGLIVNSCLLTKYQGPGDEKPVVRPYTPISDVDDKVTPRALFLFLFLLPSIATHVL